MLSWGFSLTKSTKERLADYTIKEVEEAMVLSQRTIDSIDKLSSEVVAAAIKWELGVEAEGFSSVGRAFGALQRSVEVQLINYVADTENFTYELSYAPTFLEYGHTLSEGRDNGFIPIAPLVSWIQKKKSLGVWRGDTDSRNKTDKQIAHAISKYSAQTSKQALLPNWYNPNENKKLQTRLHKAFASRKAYYVRLMSNDVKKNLK